MTTLAPRSHHGLFTSGEPVRSWTVSTAKPVRYEVGFTPDVLDPRNPALAGAGVPGDGPAPPRRLLVVETTVDELYGDRVRAYGAARGLEYEIHVLTAHERLKTMDAVFSVVEAMDRFGIARRSEPVVALGGGVLLDVVGLACSLYRRSTPFVRVPTTLVGLVDAGVGAKTGVNFGPHKNRLGTYHPAAQTLLDPRFLATLDRRHLSNGMAEILKIALIKDRDLFALLETHGGRLVGEHFQGGRRLGPVVREVLGRSVHGMLEELQGNLWESELERVVDYGHSFSPTLEMRALPELLHGEAVCLDMALTTVIAERRGLVRPAERRRILDVMRGLGLPVWHRLCEPGVLGEALADTVRHRDGSQRLPLPAGIGDAVFVDDVTPGELARAARRLRTYHAATGEAGHA
ncbi:sedoheptulose 7-phosphate cyclase [Streptomyces griseocarneus]|uniref:sedoheptulose 7-phosphate cyclase n=1 Tax=Streptomyces griseocarneus TaxID=51201 RepID=UPI0019A82FC2|nr:sedoheptulose 7-phosphate cyclase [Streptomyces griseocarneus]MBZ6475143.1 sedoheptulose 7-phosphate cyclase [Streptomyces griseocarneus]GHG62021.1 3-dehydroquinate synthase [Streptomyces griseocarneus]